MTSKPTSMRGYKDEEKYVPGRGDDALRLRRVDGVEAHEERLQEKHHQISYLTKKGGKEE